ncbi:MAG: hypothetical protein ACR2PT_14525 [Endozoicomonas sp.]
MPTSRKAEQTLREQELESEHSHEFLMSPFDKSRSYDYCASVELKGETCLTSGVIIRVMRLDMRAMRLGMFIRKAFIVVYLLYAPIAFANSLFEVESDNTTPENTHQIAIKDELLKCLTGKCLKTEPTPSWIKDEIAFFGYIDSPEDSIFLFKYIYNKATSEKKFIQYKNAKPIQNSLHGSQTEGTCELHSLLNEYADLRDILWADFSTSFIESFNNFRKGEGSFFVLVQPDLNDNRKKNVFYCKTLVSEGEL